jgi:hypothetical protein
MSRQPHCPERVLTWFRNGLKAYEAAMAMIPVLESVGRQVIALQAIAAAEGLGAVWAHEARLQALVECQRHTPPAAYRNLSNVTAWTQALAAWARHHTPNLTPAQVATLNAGVPLRKENTDG